MASLIKQRGMFFIDDEPSPRGVLDIPVSGSESDLSGTSSCGSISPEKPTVEEIPEERDGHVHQLKSMIESFKKKSVQKITTISMIAASYEMSRRSLRRKLGRFRSAEDSIHLGAVPRRPSWRNFDYAELQAATHDFSPGNYNSILTPFFKKIK